jgi:hypothetical protein
LVFGGLLGLLGIFGLQDQEKELEIPKYLILIPLIITVLLRIIPFLDNTVPLGYDPGIYKYVFETYRDHMPNIPEQSLEDWVRGSHPTGLPILTSVLYTFGFNTQTIMIPFYIFFSVIIIFSLYLAVKEYFHKKAAIISTFIFSISFAQFNTFSLFYYKNIIAINFILLFLYSLKKHNIFLTTLFATATAFIHRPTFLILALIWGIETLVNRENLKRNILAIFFSFLLVMAIYLPRFETAILDVIKPSVTQPGAGTFLSSYRYQLFSLSYFSLAIIGIAYLIKNKQFSPIVYWFFVNAVIVLLRLIFFYRFIIHLDIVMIILAALGTYRFLTSIPGKIKYLIVVLLFLAGIIVCFKESIYSQPLISQSDLDSIRMIPDYTPEDAYVVSLNSYYSPWIVGYSERLTIAPGLFGDNPWSRKEWDIFWMAPDVEEISYLLDEMPRPVYFYLGNHRSLNFMNKEKFNDECFELVFKDNGNHLFELLC